MAFAIEKAKNGQNITTKECIERHKTWYYYNEKKYVGEALSRLVKSGELVRIKQGVFTIKKTLPNSGQLQLFK